MTKNLMIQGTMSGVGKSMITAGLLRVFFHDGKKCAPFKSQNMALNSYVTDEGCEIGRAQAQQAFAAGCRPVKEMNPVLLKPDSNSSSQIIVLGKPVRNMNWREYTEYKKKLIPEILDSYEKLADGNDIIVIEGAGSPVEMNLKEDDIVNMGFASKVDAPVLLVADINPGGVFAQVYGTYMLLDDEEKKRVKGIIINKFRGDKKAFESGITKIEELTGVPVLGVVPYMNIRLDEEDSETSEFDASFGNGPLKVYVIKLPYISNYTDMLPLEEDERITLKYTDNPKDLSDAHLIILPGTKNTVNAAKWMTETGMYDALKKSASEGAAVFGICGGYQLLGEKITDEDLSEIKGAGLLPVSTVFKTEKVLTRRSGKVKTGSCASAEGYEIHMGETVPGEGAVPFFEDENGTDGCVCDKGNTFCIGTYLHGIFDSDEFRHDYIADLCKRHSLDASKETVSMAVFREKQFDILEKTLRDNLDIAKIYDIINGN